MKIEIKTKNNTIPSELIKPVSKDWQIKENKNNSDGYTTVSYGVVQVGKIFNNLGRTRTFSRYCSTCGCEPYAVWPDYGYRFITEPHYDEPWNYSDFTWKTRVDAALSPYFRNNKIQKDFDKKVADEESEMRTMLCPICGGELSSGKNEKAEIYESYKKSEAFAKSCDISVIVNINEESIVSIRTNPEKLKEYLLKVINVETNIMSIKQHLFVLYSLSYEINRQAKFSQLYPVFIEKENNTKRIDELQSELLNNSNEITELKKQRDCLRVGSIVPKSVSMPTKPVEPIKPVYLTPKIINKKVNESMAEKYNAEFETYIKALEEYHILLEAAKKEQEVLREKEILALDEKISEKVAALDKIKNEMDNQQATFESKLDLLQNKTDYPAVQLKMSLDDEIATAEELLANLFKQKNQLYGTEIIFGKYRDLAAVTSFYEYLLSGRCETLDGVNGCYNLYEAELRANLIINKLETIGDSLEQIKDNQYMLYSQLNKINSELSSLNATTSAMLNGIRDTTEVLLDQNAVIAHNSAVSAYYSKINAEIVSSDRYISMICL